MPNYRLNAEAFRVGQNNKAFDIVRGLAVRGARVTDENGEILRNFVDPQQDPGSEYNYPPADYEALKIALDPTSPPAMRTRIIRELSLDAGYRLGSSPDGHAWYTPIWVYSLVDRPVGQVALASLIDRTPYSYRMGQANVLDKDEGVVVFQEMQGGLDPETGAGVSLVMIPEGQTVKIERKGKPYSMRYDPGSHGGLVPRPINPRPSQSGPSTPPPGEGAGDREPRRPIKPLRGDSIALGLNE